VRRLCVNAYGALWARPPPPSIRFSARFSRKGRGPFGGRGPWGEHEAGLAGDANGQEAGAASGTAGARPRRDRTGADEGGEIAAIEGESAAQFVPGGRVHLPRYDAKIEADIDKNGADRAAAVLRGDLLERGRAARIQDRWAWLSGGVRLAWRGRAELSRLDVATSSGAVLEPLFERGGTEKAAGDAGENQGDVFAAEDGGEEAEEGEEVRDGGVLVEGFGEILAVGDERADDAEDLADASGHGPIWIRVDGFDRCGGCVGHDRNRSTKCTRCQINSAGGRKIFIGVIAVHWWRARRAATDRGILSGLGHGSDGAGIGWGMDTEATGCVAG